MSDISMPTEPPKEQPRKELLDNFVVKFILSLIAWGAPAPVAVVLLKLFFSYGAPASMSTSDPFMSIRHSVTDFSGGLPDLILLLSLLPSAMLLFMIFRKAPLRLAAIVVLVLVGVGEFIALSQISAE